MTDVHKLAARAERGPSVAELLAADSKPVPAALLDHQSADVGGAEVPKARYTSALFAELEARYVFGRTWQMACMEVELTEVGDHVVYDVADQSYLVVRGRDHTIRAFHNACLHRGTKLRERDGRAASFRCPFHGWRWELDGTLVELPGSWDFPDIVNDPTRSCLPQVAVALWQGFVFINPDPAATPFESYADKLIEHFGNAFRFDRRYKAFHAIKEVPANWKVVMEAFSEGYHSIATHPQILPFTADDTSEYSVWPDSPHTTRFVNAFGVQSPHLGPLTEQQVADAYLGFFAGHAPGGTVIADGHDARPTVAAIMRGAMAERFKCDLDWLTDCEVLDAILYHLFPAFAPWAGIGQPLVYRWRPGATPDTCFMDVIRLAPIPDGVDAPDPAPITVLSLDQPWSEAPGMGGLAAVFEQDMANLPRVQAGLYSRGKPTVTFGRYQEGRLRHIHQLIDRYILDGLAADSGDRAPVAPFLVR